MGIESMVLTPRLACIAALVPQGARLADVGTDHGKLPVSLLLSGRVASAIGSDIGQGPLAHAARNAAEHGVALSLRLAPGLDAVQPDECDTVSIAGMGGQTIADILADAPWCAAKRDVPLWQCAVSPALLRADGAADYLQWLLTRETRALSGMGQANAIDTARLEEQRRLVQQIKDAWEGLQ